MAGVSGSSGAGGIPAAWPLESIPGQWTRLVLSPLQVLQG